MDLPLSFYLASVFVIVITGISKSGFGGGLGVMAVPIMSVFVAPQFAAGVMMPILLAMDVLIVVRYRKHWQRAIVQALLPAALVGLCAGALSFEYMNADHIRFVVGVLAMVFVAQFLLQSTRALSPKPMGRAAVWTFGALSGFASYIAHAGGPPVKGYLLRQNLDKTDFVGTNTIYFFTLNALKTVAYGSTGTMGTESLMVSLILTPFLFLGVFVGLRLHKLVDQRIFVKVVYGFLALAAVRLLWVSVPAMFAA
ncbi:MAG: sulfite exporter TauE/SafE family protein [Pseudomonadota bacterium]